MVTSRSRRGAGASMRRLRPAGMESVACVLGGCVISPGDPTHECNDCETRYVARRDDPDPGERLPDDTGRQ